MTRFLVLSLRNSSNRLQELISMTAKLDSVICWSHEESVNSGRVNIPLSMLVQYVAVDIESCEVKPWNAGEGRIGSPRDIEVKDFLDVLFVDFDDFFVVLFLFNESGQLPILFVMLNHVIEISICWLLPILEDSLSAIKDTLFCCFSAKLLDKQLYFFLSQRSSDLVMEELFANV